METITLTIGYKAKQRIAALSGFTLTLLAMFALTWSFKF